MKLIGRLELAIGLVLQGCTVLLVLVVLIPAAMIVAPIIWLNRCWEKASEFVQGR